MASSKGRKKPAKTKSSAAPKRRPAATKAASRSTKPSSTARRKPTAGKAVAKATKTKALPKRAVATETIPARALQRVAATPAAVTRRAIFIDVENTSHESELLRAIEELQIDRGAQTTYVAAVGNWRAVAQGVARRLGAMGAQLVHSAPPPGVRDWSDLWIAVAAGRWIGTAHPGDRLEILSDDRAFDAVADAAAAAGVVFRRVSCRATRRSAAAPAVAATEESADGAPHRRRSRRGGRRRRHPESPTSTPSPAREQRERPRPLAAAPVEHDEEAHAATLDKIHETIRRLASNNPIRWVNLDVLANALKAEGYTRPPGSPRLVTRLRKIKDLEVRADGAVRLGSGHAAATSPDEPAASPTPTASEGGGRRRRRGRRGRRRPAGLGGEGEGSSESEIEAATIVTAVSLE